MMESMLEMMRGTGDCSADPGQQGDMSCRSDLSPTT